jgi:hypothetical protein
MQDYKIDVGKIEQLQMINDIQELDIIFQKAKSAVVCGALVHLGRKGREAGFEIFESISDLPDLETYRKNTYKYLDLNNRP